MRTDLLLILAEFLDNVPPEKFDMRVWRADRKTEIGQAVSPSGNTNDEALQNLSCGTVACAVGWATTLPEVKKAGLFMSKGGAPAVKVPTSMHPLGVLLAFQAVQHVFEIDYDTAASLFSGSGYKGRSYNITPKMVAEKIRSVVDAKV